MDLTDRLRQLVAALPSDDSSITLTRADLAVLLADAVDPPVSEHLCDLTVQEVASQTRRAPSTVRTWLAAGELRGYKLNGRDWRVPHTALREYLDAQAKPAAEQTPPREPVDLSAWRRVLDP